MFLSQVHDKTSTLNGISVGRIGQKTPKQPCE